MQSPLENSPEHLRLLGIITARWATLDTVLSVVLGRLIGNHTAGVALFFSSSSQQLRLAQLSAAVRVANMTPATRSKYQKLFENLNALWLKRNVLMHNPHVSSGTDNPTYSSMLTRPLKKNFIEHIPLLAKELRDHADMVSACGDELWLLSFPELIEASRKAQEANSLDKPSLP